MAIEIDCSLLEFLESVDDLQEVLLLKEKLIVRGSHVGDDVLHGEEECVLIEVGLEGIVLELLQPRQDKINIENTYSYPYFSCLATMFWTNSVSELNAL